jgi:hypothetical protein
MLNKKKSCSNISNYLPIKYCRCSINYFLMNFIDDNSSQSSHRILDTRLVDDGSLRSPLAGLFLDSRPPLQLMSISDAMALIVSQRPYLRNSIDIAVLHAQSLSHESIPIDMTLDEKCAIILYTMEQHPSENSVVNFFESIVTFI